VRRDVGGGLRRIVSRDPRDERRQKASAAQASVLRVHQILEIWVRKRSPVAARASQVQETR
jgi:hypothetical protein